jgi:large conductance mechanosensitive channel
MLKEFRDFVMRGNIVDLAVAVVIGAAFGELVNSLVVNLLTPLIAAVIGEPSFDGLSFTINGADFNYGLVLNALVTFLSVAAAVFFFVVKPLNAMQERLGSGPAEPEEPSEDVQLLIEIRDELRAQRAG